MKKCPECNNGTATLLFPVYAQHVPKDRRKPVLEIPCDRCKGTGEVSEQSTRWIIIGRKMRKDRLARGFGLRREAMRRGIKPSELSDMENGVIEPIPAS